MQISEASINGFTALIRRDFNYPDETKAITVGRRDGFRITLLLFPIAIYKGNVSGESQDGN